MVIIWLFYFLIFNTTCSTYLPTINLLDYNYKKRFRRNSKVVLVGGSNVSVGLSAAIISKNFDCINLGLSGELGSFSEYSSWIKNGVKAEILIYSTAFFWSDSLESSHPKVEFDSKLTLPPALYSQIIAACHLRIENYYFNSFGDANQFIKPNVSNFHIDSLMFRNLNKKIVLEIVRRLAVLKKNTNAKQVYLRIPPVYSSGESQKILIKLTAERIDLLTKYGVKVLNTKLVESETKYFRDNAHPNKNGNLFFTSDLLRSLNECNVQNLN